MEINKEYSMAYVEVLEVLKKLKQTEYRKVPKKKIEFYEKYKDKTYEFRYDKSKNIECQISDAAKAVLANIFIKYIATLEDRNEILQKDRLEFYKSEKQKSEIKLNPLFEKKKKINVENQQNALVKVERKNIFQKIILKIKKILRKDKSGDK